MAIFRSLLLRVFAAIGVVTVLVLIGVGIDRHAYAQGVSAGSGRGPSGLRTAGNEFFFDTPSGSVAATRMGVYTPPMQEPTRIDQSGAMWAYVSGPSDNFVWELKFNIAGTVLTVARGKWTLPQQ